MGQRRRFGGPGALSFACWASEVKHYFDISVQEITALFDDKIFAHILPDFNTESQAGLERGLLRRVEAVEVTNFNYLDPP